MKLKYPMVGVRFFESQADFDRCTALPPAESASYCRLVKAAMQGGHCKAGPVDINCPFGADALGLLPQGEGRIRQPGIRQLPAPMAGLEIGPFNEVAAVDVAIVVDTPLTVMEILRAYTAAHGIKQDFCLAGSQAMCSECTATPYLAGDINLSLLCDGSRAFGGWEESDMAVGMPAKMAGIILPK